jgi:fucose permease
MSLGLPDSLLGSAWPVMHNEISVPVSYAGIISMTITAGTILSSLFSDKLLHKFGAGLVTAVSVTTTAICLFGFSISTHFWMLILWAIPFGLGAGGVDAILNNYVALNFKAQHMSWLHCMWGVGASIGPYIMGIALSTDKGWNKGYFYISIIQLVIAFIVLMSLPIWKNQTKTVSPDETVDTEKKRTPLSFKEILSIPGAKSVMITFFCYCALECTAILWASSYLNLHRGIDADLAATFGSMFLLGITVGRAINGFIAMKLSDTTMIRIGEGIIFLGVIMIILPISDMVSLVGLVIMGVGCAPVYPSIIHSTPLRFGADKSQAIIGVQMACAYTGSCLMPPLFGLIANHITIALFPIYMGIILVTMIITHELLCKKHPIK